MPSESPYDQLIAHMRNWLFELPESELLRPMLKLRFSEEEAEFLARFPHRPGTLEELSEILDVPADELLKTMDPMIRKGLICEFEGRSGCRYAFTDQVFFFSRMPGWKGEDDEWNRKIAKLFNRYYLDHFGADFMGHPTKGLRAVPIARTVADPRQIIPYEDVVEFVEREDFHSVTSCACRHRHNIDPAFETCKHEVEVCLHFGKLARYTVKYDMGRKIAPEETFEILERSADAGLVHGISNTRKGMDTICNCCSCCCIFLESAAAPAPLRPGHNPSNYMLELNRDTCIACGLCVQRCPTDALELTDKPDAPAPAPDAKLKPADLKEIAYYEDRCIGCGVCAHKCPTRSLSLVRRRDEQDHPETMSELGRRFMIERNRDLSKVF